MNDHEKTLTILGSLANGADPITGEILPASSPYNNPDVIRALFFSLKHLEQEAKSWTPKTKKTKEEKQQANLQNGRPRNAGLPWDDESREYVASSFRSGNKIEAIAAKLERSNIAIITELRQQGVISPEDALSLSTYSSGRTAPALRSQ